MVIAMKMKSTKKTKFTTTHKKSVNATSNGNSDSSNNNIILDNVSKQLDFLCSNYDQFIM